MSSIKIKSPISNWLKYKNGPSENEVVRVVQRTDGVTSTSRVWTSQGIKGTDLSAEFDRGWLQSKSKPPFRSRAYSSECRVADLFSGCGGMSVGAEEACRALGFHFRPKIAMDFDKPALTTYNNNFPSARTVHYPIESIIDGGLGGQRTSSEEDFLRSMGRIDLVLAGPPCQGHSNLNNHTRRLDPKNLLMLRVVRFVELVQPKYVIVENVPQARLDRHGTPKVAISELKKMGYSVASGVVDMSTIGVPQRRKRFVIIAAKGHWVPEISTLISPHQAYGRDLEWAIGDLEKTPREGILNSAANASMDNLRRMDFLFDNDLFDLPDALRPDCHRLKTHSYGAVYGRLRWNEPAPTITTGYGSMGQGRYVHPSRRSTITPREAARLQFFPDFFNFSGMTRTSLAKMIGNAVPPRLVFALVLGLMR